MIQYPLRIPKELKEKLEKMAIEDKRSLNSFLNKVLYDVSKNHKAKESFLINGEKND